MELHQICVAKSGRVSAGSVTQDDTVTVLRPVHDSPRCQVPMSQLRCSVTNKRKKTTQSIARSEQWVKDDGADTPCNHWRVAGPLHCPVLQHLCRSTSQLSFTPELTFAGVVSSRSAEVTHAPDTPQKIVPRKSQISGTLCASRIPTTNRFTCCVSKGRCRRESGSSSPSSIAPPCASGSPCEFCQCTSVTKRVFFIACASGCAGFSHLSSCLSNMSAHGVVPHRLHFAHK